MVTVTLDDLRIPVFSGIADDILDKVVPLCTKEHYEEGQTIFKPDEVATHIYIVKSGKVLMERDLSQDITVAVSVMEDGHIFGLNALAPEVNYTFTAITRLESEIIAIPSLDLTNLMEEDHSVSHALYKTLFSQLLEDMEGRIDIFMRMLVRNPELKDVL